MRIVSSAYWNYPNDNPTIIRRLKALEQILSNGHQTFFEISIRLPNSCHAIKTYRCMGCGKILMSKTGAITHQCCCEKQVIMGLPNVPKQMIMDLYLRKIATTNSPFLSAEDENMRLCLHCLNPFFELPRRDKLRQHMIDLAQRIRMQMLENLRDRVVSLMIDGCKRWGRLYEGVVIYTSERLYLYSVLKMRDGTARTLEAILAEVIETLL